MTAKPPPRKPLRVLCVEEDAIQRRLLKASLEVMGAEAIIVNRALDAVWTFRRQAIDLVFLDIDQHVANGLMAFEAIRATPVRGKAVPIVAVTENECRWSDHDYREAGFAALFVKPIEPTRLFKIIDQIMGDWRPPPLETAPQKRTTQMRTFGQARVIAH